MICPICKKDMKLNREDISFRSDGKQYRRKIYWCEDDDAWINYETPIDKNLA
jgi:hypothetical protein